MRITPPFGYTDVTPLLKTHRVLPVSQRPLAAFARTANAMPVTMSEIPVAAHDYPVVFTASADQSTFNPVVILGISAGENLFVRDNVWMRGVYVPAYVRRHPFCMTRVVYEGTQQSQRVICVQTDMLADDGEPLFDADGKPLASWADTDRLLGEFENDLDRTIEMCNILRDYKLLEPFNMQATFNVGGAFQLDGMYRVDEKRIEDLNANQLKTLIKKGILARAYQHLGSLSSFNRLIELKGALLVPGGAMSADGAAAPTIAAAPA